jgi:hypothetical protein
LGAAFRYDNQTLITQTDEIQLPEGRRQKHADDARKVMAMMFTDMPQEHKVEAFRVMSRAYAGVGWDREGVNLKNFYETRDDV